MTSMATVKRKKINHPEVEVSHTFKVHVNNHDPYEPLKIELLADMRVRASQGENTTEPHGYWTLDPDGLMTTMWHYQGNIMKAKLQYFHQIPHTDAFERINCDNAWRTILIPWKDN